MFENVDERTDTGVTGILIAHLGAFGSGELKWVHIDQWQFSYHQIWCKVARVLQCASDHIEKKTPNSYGAPAYAFS